MANGGSRGDEEGLALFLRRETKFFHDVAEERFLALAAAGPARRTRQLRQLHDQLIDWFPQHAENALPDKLRLAMSDYSSALRAHPGNRSFAGSTMPLRRNVRLDDQAEAVGAAYVLCGAAVGVRSLAKSWGTVIPGDDGRWAALCEAAAMLVARWRDLRAAIDIWGAEHPDDWEDALRGASTAFCVAIDVIEATGELEEV